MDRKKLLTNGIMQISGQPAPFFKHSLLRGLLLLDHFLLAKLLEQLHLLLNSGHHRIELKIHSGKGWIGNRWHPDMKISFGYLKHIQMQHIDSPLNSLSGQITDNNRKHHYPHHVVNPHVRVRDDDISR
ncbi:hypothetical protein D3C85_1091660 [compost metagenome]